MNISSSYKYQLDESKKGIIIFGGIMLGICLISFIVTLLNPQISGSVNGTGTSWIVFGLVYGIASFKESFSMNLQNGVSRKSYMKAKTISLALICVILGVIELIIDILYTLTTKINSGIECISLVNEIYSGFYSSHSMIVNYLTQFAFNTMFMLCAAMFGTFIGVLYYKMSKGAKIAVSVGAPAFCFVGLPLIEGYITHGAISKFLYDALIFCFGFKNSQPYMAVAFFAVLTIVFAIVSTLITYKTPLKA